MLELEVSQIIQKLAVEQTCFADNIQQTHIFFFNFNYYMIDIYM